METLNIYFETGGSWEVLGRGLATALGRNIPVALINTITTDARSTGDSSGFHQSCVPVHKNGVTLNLGDWRRSKHLPGKTIISYVAWETTRIPEPHFTILNRLEHIWVPSHWQKNIFTKNGLRKERIRVVPEGFDPCIYYPPTKPRSSPSPYRFLFVGKWEERKGIHELLTAFTREFTKEEPVELLLAAHNPFLRDFDTERALQFALKKLGAQGDNIHILPPAPNEKMGDIYRNADAFVLPTKAEGWGLPLLEAMACGLPCIATGYSGLTEFASEDCTYHLQRGLWLEKVKDPVFYNAAFNWGRWARPRIRHLRRLLRHVYENPAEARHVGQKAAQIVHADWTWDHAARKALTYLPA